MNITNNEIIPPELNYTIYRNDRKDGYDGVLIAVSKKFTSVHEPQFQTSCELVWTKIMKNYCKPIFVGAYHRPHVSDHVSIEQLETSLSQLTSSAPNSIVCLAGDFNAPILISQTCVFHLGILILIVNSICWMLLRIIV